MGAKLFFNDFLFRAHIEMVERAAAKTRKREEEIERRLQEEREREREREKEGSWRNKPIIRGDADKERKIEDREKRPEERERPERRLDETNKEDSGAWRTDTSGTPKKPEVWRPSK